MTPERGKQMTPAGGVGSVQSRATALDLVRRRFEQAFNGRDIREALLDEARAGFVSTTACSDQALTAAVESAWVAF